jgi:carbohydrate-selective porin OprB
LGNVSGGLKQGAVYDGWLNLAVDVDLQKLARLQGLTFHANMFQTHGDGLSRSNLDNYLVASGIEALPSTRLARGKRRIGDGEGSQEIDDAGVRRNANSACAFELARCVTGNVVTVHAGFANVNALTEFPRIKLFVSLGDAKTLLIRVNRFLRTRRKADATRTMRLRSAVVTRA